MKKILALVLCVAFVVTSFAACGGDKGGNDATVNTDYSEKFTYTINLQNAEKEFSPAFKQLCEKFNVEFDVYPITSGDWQEKVRIWMATGDMPDVLWANIQNFNYSEFMSWAKDGLLKPMGDLSKYPNVYASQQALASAPYFQVDGETYAYLSPNLEGDFIPEGKHYNTYSFMYRRDWVEELGMATDDNVYTWDQFLEIGKAMNEKLGKIGLVGSAGTYPHFSGMMQVSPYWEQYVKKGDDYVWGMDLPETLDAIKMSKYVYDEGILWSDMVLASGSEGNDKFKAGEAGIVFEGITPGTIKNYVEDMEEAGIEDVYSKLAIMHVKAPNGKFWGQECMDYWTLTAVNPSMSDEKFDRLMQMYDYLLSDDEEIKNLRRYGVEGEEYTKNADGTVSEPLIENLTNGIMGAVVSNDRAFNYENLRVPEEARKLGMEVVEKLTSDEADPRVYDYPLYFFSAPNKDKYGLFYEDGRTKIKQIIMGSTDVEGDWEAWKATVRDKVELVLDEINTALK